MPSGAVTLLEASKYGDNLLKKGVVETIVRESPVLERLPQVPIAGNALEHTEEGTLPTPEFRKVNATYSKSFGSDTQHFWGVTILGGEVEIDNYLINVAASRGDLKARQWRKFAKAMALKFDYTFFKGDGTNQTFKGLNTLIDEGFGFEFDNGTTNGSPLDLDAMEEAHDLLRVGEADLIYLHRSLRRYIKKLALTYTSGVSLIDVGDDRFGRKITQWNGIPLAIPGDGPDGSLILDFDETTGSSSVTTSLYMVKFGMEENVTGLMGAGGHFEVKDFGEQEAKPAHLGRVEVYPGIAVFNKYSVVRYSGITQP